MSLLNKISRFANSPEGRRTISGFTNRGGTSAGRGTAGRGMRTSRRSAPMATGTGGAGGMLGRLASGFLGGRRRV